MPSARRVADLHPWPAELLDPAVLPDPYRVVEGAMPFAVLLRDDDDRELLEPQRDVEPPEAVAVVVHRSTGRLAVADGADAPGTVAAADPGVGVDGELLAVDAEYAA